MDSQSSALAVTLGTGLSRGYQADVAGAPQFRCRLSTVITGAGSVAVTQLVTSAPMVPGLVAAIDPASGAGIFWSEATAGLISAATGTYATRDTGIAQASPHSIGYFNAVFRSDQAATAFIQFSDDAGTWVDATAGLALGANVTATVSLPIMARYHRAKLVMGATGNTAAPTIKTGYTAA